MKSTAYSIQSVEKITNGTFFNFSSNDLIYELTTDSRQMINRSFLFFAIVSERSDGHNYIRDAYSKGVRNFVLSHTIDFGGMEDANFILVEDSLRSMQYLVKHHRSNFTLPIIGITGSNGKTVVKEWLFQLLQNDFRIVRNPKSYNSQLGVPLSVWKISAEDELGIFEAGISKPGEMQYLEGIIQPDIGILTNIGDAHLENFSSKSDLVKEKAKLFTSCRKLVYCIDIPEMKEIANKLDWVGKIAWSYKNEKSNYFISKIKKNKASSTINAIAEGKEYIYSIPFIDQASIENSISCFFALFAINALNEKILRGMEDLQSVAMRLEIKEGINGSLLINDSYNSDLQSLKIALQLLSHYHHSKKILILSDLMQVSHSKVELYMEIADLVEERGIDLFVGIGENLIQYSYLFPKGSCFYSEAKEFISDFNINSIENSAVLIKGARKFGLEKISELLQQKSHETILEINLNAVIENLNYFRSLLKKQTKVMVMVKAFSYGAGGSEIAKILQFHQVDYLGVAYADEGIELRKAGISAPIMVMNPELGSFENVIRNRLEPEIYSFRVLRKFKDAISANQYFASVDDPYPVHIKLDSGMHRLGFAQNDMAQLIEELNAFKSIKVVSIFSHLTSSEDQSEDEHTLHQITSFSKMADELISGIGYRPILHVLNSNGALRFPQFQFDMIRLGIGLHGIVEEEKHQKQLKEVSKLKTHISQIKALNAGDTVGYSRKGVKAVAGKIATIPIGYADGLGRTLGNGNWQVQIGRNLFPIIGMVCMDMCMIDLLDKEFEEGDEVVVFGDKKSIKDLAFAMEKSPYEVLTGISSRVKRIYYFE